MTSGDAGLPAPDAPSLPGVPADIMTCARAPTDNPDRDLDAGEVERLWKTDRAALAKVNACLHRLICQNLEVNRDIAYTDGVVCTDAPPAAKPARVAPKRIGVS